MKFLDFPELRQTFEYDCGAKALQAVLVYYGVEVREEILIKFAHTNAQEGTSIHAILHILEKFGLKYDSRAMTSDELRNYIDKQIPIIILLQAWNFNENVEYRKDYKDGHWVVAIGHNKNRIYFEDPYSFEWTYLTNKELDTRWHGIEKGKKIINHGIAVFGKEPVFSSKKIIHMK